MKRPGTSTFVPENTPDGCATCAAYIVATVSMTVGICVVLAGVAWTYLNSLTVSWDTSAASASPGERAGLLLAGLGLVLVVFGVAVLWSRLARSSKLLSQEQSSSPER